MTTNVTEEQYIRTLAQYIRSNERRIFTHSSPPPSSVLTGHKRSDSGSGSFSMTNLWSFSTALTSSYLKQTISTSPTAPASPLGSAGSPKNILVTLDLHHLYFLLTQFSELGLDVGFFEVAADPKGEDGGTYAIDTNDPAETMSVASVNSINSVSSAMSSLSLFSGWQGWSNAAQKNENIPIKQEVQYIYRAFTRLSGLKLAVNIQKRIDGSDNWPMSSLLSLSYFKQLTHLEVSGIAPKMIDGWDILQEKLEYLSLQQGSIDDIYELFVDAVVDGLKRRKQKNDKTDSNDKHVTEVVDQLVDSRSNLVDYSPDSILPPKIWSHLKTINLSDNSLTFVANEPLSYLTECARLDLSNNLLIAVPSGLSQLFNLQYLNLSNNMIETVTGIYQILNNITRLDLRNNRIENLCGLERLWSLEYVDVRDNRLSDWEEAKRMTELPEIKYIYVEGNLFTKFQTYRDNNVDIILDGSGPSYSERRQLTNNRLVSSSFNTPVAIQFSETPLSTSPEEDKPMPILRTKKSLKFRKRVVNLDGEDSGADTGPDLAEVKSLSSKSEKKKKKDKSSQKAEAAHSKHRLVEVEKAVAAENDPARIKKKRSTKFRQNSAEASPRIRPSSPHNESEVEASGEDYRRKIEELRTEGGSAWLRVLSEMEYSKGGNDRLREPPKMKVIEPLISREHA
ncbi:9589_t:CDS:2 [Acaulospora colombiana]|uniref:9589_t:CDS:1 n=1 Tax=Acaulospora colombiana TaxID=27376 RepID=A0ACA9KAY9_9GLOM|nr:9589_t:CDS:2 [Acaulospora colombiana]